MQLREQIQAKEFNAVVLQLPMSGMGRAQHFSSLSTKPLRGRQHPFGFPWLDHEERSRADRTTLEAASMLLLVQECVKEQNSHVVLTAPEDLGSTLRGEPCSGRRQSFSICSKKGLDGTPLLDAS